MTRHHARSQESTEGSVPRIPWIPARILAKFSINLFDVRNEFFKVQFHQKNHETDKIKMVSVNNVDWKLPVILCNNSKKPSKKVKNVLMIDFPKFFTSPKI